MSAVAVAAALVVAAAAIAALALADPRLGLVALAAALVGAALVADPLPGPAILGVRLSAALLAVAVLHAAGPTVEARRGAGGSDIDGHSQLGWPAETLLGLAGGAAGLAISAGIASLAPVTATSGAVPSFLGGSPLSAESLALALAGGILAIALPAVAAGAGLRRATAALLTVQGVVLARVGLGEVPSVLEEIVLGVLLVTVAATAALLASAGRTVPEGGPGQA